MHNHGIPMICGPISTEIVVSGLHIHRMNHTYTGIRETRNGGLMVRMEMEFELYQAHHMLLLHMGGVA